MKNNDSLIGAEHQLAHEQPVALTTTEIVPDEGEAMAGAEKHSGIGQMVLRDDAQHRGDIDAQPTISADHVNHKDAVNGHKSAVVNAEEGNHEDFLKQLYRFLGAAENHLEHIKAADDHVLQPEQEDQRKDLPVKEQYPKYRHQVGQH